MADDRIDLQISDKIDAGVISKLKEIAKYSKDADTRTSSLRKTVGTLNEVSSATARTGQEAAKAANATERWQSATAKLNATNRKSVSTINSVSKAILSLSDQELNASAAANRAESATIRYSIAQRRAQITSLSMDRATNRVAIDLLKSANAADRSRISTLALSNSQIRNEQATRRMSSAQQRLTASTTSAFRSLSAYVGGGLLVRELYQLADGYTLLQNKLKVVTETSSQLANVTESVYDVANRTYAPVEATAQAFQRFDRALSQLGATQQESIRLTETINKTIQLSGANTGEAQSALLQLSQAFNKGKLDGDEFRTVMELMPDVADAIASKLGVVRGELLELAPQGKITGQVMREALADAAEEIDAKFSKLTPTMGQAFTTLSNSISQYIGEGNKAIGVTDSIADVAIWASENVDGLAAGIVILAGPAVIGKAITGVKALTLAMYANPWTVVIGGATAAVAAMAVFRDEISLAGDGIVQINSGLTTLGDQLRGIRDAWERPTGGGFLADIERYTDQSRINRLAKKIRDEAASSTSEAASSIAGAAASAIRRPSAQIQNQERRRASGVVQRVKIDPDDYSEILYRNIAALLEERESLEKVGQAYKEAQVFEKINAEFLKNNIQLRQADRGVLQELIADVEKKKAVHSELNAIYAENTGAEQKLMNQYTATDLALEKGIYTEEQHRRKLLELDDATIKLGASNEVFSSLYDERIVKQRELQQSVDGLAQALKAEVITEREYENAVRDVGIKLFKRAENSQELNAIIDDSLGKYYSLTDSIYAVSRAQELGIINIDTYRQKMADLRLEFAELNLQMNEASFGDVMLTALDQVTNGFANMATSVSDTMGGLFSSLSDGFADSIGRAIVMGDDLGDSLRNVARGAMAELISSIVKMGIQWAVTQAVQSAASTAAMTATTAASIANATATAAAWAPAAAGASLASFGANAAPASAGIASTYALSAGLSKTGFYDGGYTGNIPKDDIAGVVHGREFVMTADTVNRIGINNLQALQDGVVNIQRPNTTTVNNKTVNNGGGAVPEMRVVNVIDPEMVANYLTTDAGADVLVNVINANRESLNF